LLASPIDFPSAAFSQDTGPILDLQAKAQYKHRIDELRNDLEEAKRFNDSYRATKTRSEMDDIAEQLAAAVGLGGRDRRSSSEAERAAFGRTKGGSKGSHRKNQRGHARARPPLGRENQDGILLLLQPHPDATSPGSSDFLLFPRCDAKVTV